MRNVIVLALAASTMFRASSVSATEKAGLSLSLTSGYVQGFGLLEITPVADNKVSVLLDQRNSSRSEVGVVPQIVEPEIISNEADDDGSILIQLTERVNLSITRRIDGKTTIEAYVKGPTPTAADRVLKMEMQLHVRALSGYPE